MNGLQTSFAGLKLKNPIVAASSGLTNTWEKIRQLEEAGVGAVVLKSLFEEQIENHSEKLAAISDYPEAAAYINAYIEMNHLEKYLHLIRAAKEKCSVPVIASINCRSYSRWVDFAGQIEKAGADALEINVLTLSGGELGNRRVEDTYRGVVGALRKNIGIPIVVKLMRAIDNLPALVADLNASGAKGIVLFNRFYPLDIDIRQEEIVAGPVFSHPSEFGETLRWTAIVAGRQPKADIACSYGAHSWEDIVKGILAGASAIELCSVLYEKGFDIVGEMLTCLEEWMALHGYDKIGDFKGKLSYANIPDPSVYERVQFMKYFSNYQ